MLLRTMGLASICLTEKGVTTSVEEVAEAESHKSSSGWVEPGIAVYMSEDKSVRKQLEGRISRILK